MLNLASQVTFSILGFISIHKKIGVGVDWLNLGSFPNQKVHGSVLAQKTHMPWLPRDLSPKGALSSLKDMSPSKGHSLHLHICQGQKTHRDQEKYEGDAYTSRCHPAGLFKGPIKSTFITLTPVTTPQKTISRM
jgi:hypothetical protein